MKKAVREVEFKFFTKYIDALMNENYYLKTLEIENNQYEESVSVEFNGKTEDFRLKRFQRQNNEGNFLESVYIQIS